MPYEFPHEEIWFWGMSLRQIIYVVSAVLMLFILFIPIYWILKLFLFLIIDMLLLMCAFLKINNLYFDKYLIVLFNYITRKKEFKYER